MGASVLDLQASFHVGVYSAEIGVPGGAITPLAQHGTFNMASVGGLNGALDTWEWSTTGGVFTPNDPVSGTYHVAPDGIIEFDFHPGNPGNDVFELVIDSDGARCRGIGRGLDEPRLQGRVLSLGSSFRGEAARRRLESPAESSPNRRSTLVCWPPLAWTTRSTSSQPASRDCSAT